MEFDVGVQLLWAMGSTKSNSTVAEIVRGNTEILLWKFCDTCNISNSPLNLYQINLDCLKGHIAISVYLNVNIGQIASVKCPCVTTATRTRVENNQCELWSARFYEGYQAVQLCRCHRAPLYIVRVLVRDVLHVHGSCRVPL